jgi:hypothetical protein
MQTNDGGVVNDAEMRAFFKRCVNHGSQRLHTLLARALHRTYMFVCLVLQSTLLFCRCSSLSSATILPPPPAG